MKRIDNLKDLEPYGLDALTGESDQHMHRILFDVTAKGKRIIERTMDVQLTLSENWNRGKKRRPLYWFAPLAPLLHPLYRDLRLAQ